MTISEQRKKQAEEQETRLRIQRRRILRMNEVGYSNSEIARAMGISENTVRTVVKPKDFEDKGATDG